MMFAAGEAVTRQRATRTSDRYNPESTTLDWTSPDSQTIIGCGVALSSTTEPLLDARMAVDSDFTVFAPAGSDVTSADRLTIRGLVCDVVGRPFDWVNPFTGWAPGLVVQAKVREG